MQIPVESTTLANDDENEQKQSKVGAVQDKTPESMICANRAEQRTRISCRLLLDRSSNTTNNSHGDYEQLH